MSQEERSEEQESEGMGRLQEQSNDTEEVSGIVPSEEKPEGAKTSRPPSEAQLFTDCLLSQAPGTGGSPVYVVGKIRAEPLPLIQREVEQALAGMSGKGTQEERFHNCLCENAYLLPHLCWILSVKGVDSYILRTDNPNFQKLLLEAIQPPSESVLHVVIGEKGPIGTCNAAVLPLIGIHQIYWFTRDQLADEIRKAVSAKEESGLLIRELLDKFLDAGANLGEAGGPVAFLAIRELTIYDIALESDGEGYLLTALNVRPSPVTPSGQNIVTVIFEFKKPNGLKKVYGCDVDCTGPFPFVIDKPSLRLGRY